MQNYALGMNILDVVENEFDTLKDSCLIGATENERTAYLSGAKTVLNILETNLNDGPIVVHLKDLNIPTEISIDDIEHYLMAEMEDYDGDV